MKRHGVNLDPVKSIRWEGWPNVLDAQQFSPAVLEPLMRHVVRVEHRAVEGLGMLRVSEPSSDKRVLLEHFDEPSTRTVDTFHRAAHDLGYEVRVTFGPFSSAKKGELPGRTAMALTQVGGMGSVRGCDVFVIRSKVEGAAHQAVHAIEMASRDGCKRLPLPVINAGDGARQHPTQALVDLATIYRERSCTGLRHQLDGITVAMIGDIALSRTIRSLCYLLGQYSPSYAIRIIFCSHPSVPPHEGIIEYLKEHEVEIELSHDFEKAVREADVWYLTRIQRDRRTRGQVILRPDDRARFQLREEHLKLLKPDAFVMHPLPVNEDPDDPPPEIEPCLWDLAYSGDRRCAWARQSHRGYFVRYVLLDLIEYGLQQLAKAT